MVSQFDYRNGRYEGLVDGRERHGQGLFIDDRSNVVLSDWHRDKPNGDTFIAFGREFICIYGMWTEGRPNGINTVEYDGLRMIAQHVKGKIGSTILVIDDQNGLVYIVDNRSRYPDDFTITNRLQLASVKVADLTALLGLSYQLQPESLEQFLQRAVTNKHQTAHYALCFLQEQGSKWFLGFRRKGRKHGLGISFSSHMEIASLGRHNEHEQLEGICSIRRGDVMEEGIAGGGLVSFLADEQQKKREWLKEHLGSLNFQNHGVYFDSVKRLREQFAAVVRVFTRFERSFRGSATEQKGISEPDSLELEQPNRNVVWSKKVTHEQPSDSEKSEDMGYQSKYSNGELNFNTGSRTRQQTRVDSPEQRSGQRKAGFIRTLRKPDPKETNEAEPKTNSRIAVKHQLHEYFAQGKSQRSFQVRHTNNFDSVKTLQRISTIMNKSSSRSPIKHEPTSRPAIKGNPNSPPQTRWKY